MVKRNRRTFKLEGVAADTKEREREREREREKERKNTSKNRKIKK